MNNRQLSTTSENEGRGEQEWSQFADEHEEHERLDEKARSVWNAEMKVKTELAKDLAKEMNTQFAQKRFTKLKAGDVFERWARDFKTELMPIPLCGKRLELGALANPRRQPDKNANLFEDEDGNFQSQSYELALLLFELVKELVHKISSFIYSSLTYCMAENPDAQQIIRSEQDRDIQEVVRTL